MVETQKQQSVAEEEFLIKYVAGSTEVGKVVCCRPPKVV